MQNQFSESMSTKKKIIRKVWFWILIGLVSVLVLFIIMLPLGIDYGIERYLKDQGADQVSLNDVNFNPITGRMTLTNLTVIIGNQTVLQIPQAILKIQWSPFISKRFVLERFIVSDVQLTIEELDDGRWQIAGIKLPDTSETVEPSAWAFGLQQVNIKNSIIKLIRSQLSSDLKIEEATISKLSSWMPEDSARLELTGQLNDARMQLQMDVSPFGSDIAAAGRIMLKRLKLNPFNQLLQPHLKTLEGRLDMDVSIETRLTADGAFNHHQKGPLKLHRIRTQIADVNLSKDNLAWDGAIRVDIPKPEEALQISADGQINGSKLTIGIENKNIKVQQDKFSWKGKIDYTHDKTNRKINTDGQISLADLKMESPELNLAEEKFTWKGAFEFSSTAKAEGQRISADGTLDGNHLQVRLPARKLSFEHQGLSWKGRLDSGGAIDFSSFETEANVILNDIQILHSETDQGLLNAKQLDLQSIKVEGLDKIEVSGLVLNELALLPDLKSAPATAKDSTPLRIQEVKLKDARLSHQNNLAIDGIYLTAVQAFVHRDTEGRLLAIDRWEAIRDDAALGTRTQQTASDSKTEAKSGEFGFRIGQFEIAGESGLRFTDESVTPEFGIDLNIIEARLSNLDNSRSKQPSSVKLLVSDKENARLSLDGTIQPFGGQLSLDWVGKVEALELPLLSPYVIKNTGYRFISGEMQADIPIKINQNQLEGKIDLILYNPKVKRIKAEKPPEENRGKIRLNISLDSALRLLRDEQNDVKLNIPISGNISDPQFSVSGAVNKVLAKTLQKSALSYLKYMLGPYGIGISVAQLAYEQATKVRLNPILFAPGSDDLDEAAIDYLQRIAAIMKEYPAVQVSVCGVATESDRAAMKANASIEDSALLELAKNRTERIEDQLVKSHEIGADRIVACTPEIDSNAKSKPRADLEL